MQDPPPPKPAALDALTIGAIGMVAYLLANLIHEALGHGGACLLVGGRPLGLSSAWFSGDLTGVSAWGNRAEKAGGTLANLLFGLIFFVWCTRLRARPKPPAQLYYFVWLSMTVNLLQGAGYLMVSPLAGFGDWKEFIIGLAQPLLWKLGLTAVGLALSYAALMVAIRTVEPLLGGDDQQRSHRVRWLCFIPYGFAGALVFSIAALLNPGGKIFLITSAAAHLGGTAWLAWLPQWIKSPRATTPKEPLSLSRHTGWMVAGVVAVIVCIFVLGPAIDLR